MWRAHAFVEAAVHVASRDKNFDAEVFRPALEKLPILLLHLLINFRYEGTIKNFTSAKFILSRPTVSLEMVANYVTPASIQCNRLDALIGVLS